VSVEVEIAVPVACRVPEPQCAAPAYDAARAEDALDVLVKLMRAEMRLREDCVKRYREALAACREAK